MTITSSDIYNLGQSYFRKRDVKCEFVDKMYTINNDMNYDSDLEYGENIEDDEHNILMYDISERLKSFTLFHVLNKSYLYIKSYIF